MYQIRNKTFPVLGTCQLLLIYEFGQKPKHMSPMKLSSCVCGFLSICSQFFLIFTIFLLVSGSLFFC